MVPGSDVGMGIVYRRLTPLWATEVATDLLQRRLRNATVSRKHFAQTSDASKVTNTMSRRGANRGLNPLCNNMLRARVLRESSGRPRNAQSVDVGHLQDMRWIPDPRDREHSATDAFGRGDRRRRDPLQDRDKWLDDEVGCVVPTCG